MDLFSIRDLRERSGDLVREAQEGRLSVVSKHGRAVFIAVPFDETLLREGVAVAMACKLYAEGTLSLSRAARLADLSQEQFVTRLGASGVSVSEMTASELDAELELLRAVSDSHPASLTLE